MEQFRYIDDVEAWLEPMNYEEFWLAVRPHYLVLEHRHICDAQIASGEVDRETVLIGLKAMAAYELRRRHRLERKPPRAVLRLVHDADAR